jgi:hypothetical protein
VVLTLSEVAKINLTEPSFHLVNIGAVQRGTKAVFEVVAQDSEVFETCYLLLFFVHGAELLVGPLTYSLMAYIMTHRDLRL